LNDVNIIVFETRRKITNNNPKEKIPSRKDFDTQKKKPILFQKKTEKSLIM
jgi:hypothetical protein